MQTIYLAVDGDTATNIFSAGSVAVVADTQVTAEILATWDDAELAALGIVRAPVVVPTVDPAVEALTGLYAARQSGAGWQWVAEVCALTTHEVAEVLAMTKVERIAHLRVCCAATIIAGFSSNALGLIHTYPSSPTDQINMLGRAAQAQLDPAAVSAHWCADDAGVWAKRQHSAAQMIRVGQDGAAWVQTNSDRLSGPDGTGGLIAQVQAAITIAEVEAVVWSETI